MSTARLGNVEAKIKSKTDSTSTLSTLHSNLEAIFAKFDRDNRGSIIAQDLFPILDFFEREQGVALLDLEPKDLLQKFCAKNAELELSPQDLYRLISQLSAPSPTSTALPKTSVKNSRPPTTPRPHSTLGFTHPLSPLASRQRTTPVTRTLSTRKAAADVDKRRDAYAVPNFDDFDDEDTYLFKYSADRSFGRSNSSPHSYQEVSPRFSKEPLKHSRSSVESRDKNLSNTYFLEKSFEDFDIDSKEAASQIGNLSRISLELNKRLRQTEKNLTLSVRQHEERISELQTRVDEMKLELTTKKREIQEFKSNEKAHLQQISLLEIEIVSISRVLSHHKNLYSDLRQQYEEKREETEKLQLQLKIREEELLKGEMDLENYVIEQRRYQQERSAFEIHISKLEQEVSFAQTLELEVDELKEENQHLRDVVDRLRQDLDDAIKGVNIKTGSTTMKNIEDISSVESEKNLHFELTSMLEDQCNGIYLDSLDDENRILPALELNNHFELHDQNHSYIAYLEDQNKLFRTEAEDASRKWENAVYQLQEAKKAIAHERQCLQEEINHLRENIKPSFTQEIGIQCDYKDELPTNDSHKSKAQSKLSGESMECEVDAKYKDEFHQNLEMEYRKLIDNFKAQETLIHELLSDPANSGQVSQTFDGSTKTQHRNSELRQNLVRRRRESVITLSKQVNEVAISSSHNTALVSRTRGYGTITVILYTLVVYILGIVTTMFLQQPMIGHKVREISTANGTAMTWYPEHHSTQDHEQPRTRPLDYLIYWFQALAQEDELIQVPT
ncbi:hypothetical protein K7432_010164 [Basidiobolus ranarum]|uniref:EF-hand domain-containing protein n=1 Tax=Basidiobolus ranarum TaxID=34480 RepID=A0ABR2WP66_9FUNG